MSLPYKTMAEVAEAASVPYCRGILPTGQYCQEGPLGSVVAPLMAATASHAKGFATDDFVHLSDRKVTRSAILQFAKLAAKRELGDTSGWPAWRVGWLVSSRAEEICRLQLRVRIPKSAWDLDRWTVRAQLVGVPMKTLQREEAMAWTRLAS